MAGRKLGWRQNLCSLLLLTCMTVWSQAANASQQKNIEQLTQDAESVKLTDSKQKRLMTLDQKAQTGVQFPLLDEMAIYLTRQVIAPDERYLWQMLHHGELSALHAELRRLYKFYPGWIPPIALVRSLKGRTALGQSVHGMEHHPALALKLSYFLAQNPNDPGVIYGKEIKAYQVSGQVQPTHSLVLLVEGRKDSNVARLFAWNALKAQKFDLALHWFEQALNWSGGDADARYGLSLTYYQMGDLDLALQHLDDLATPVARKLRGDVLYAQGLAAYQAGDYKKANIKLTMAANMGRDARDLRLIQAWTTYKLADYPAALQDFLVLYKASPDKATAQGAFLSASAMHQVAQLNTWMGAGSADPLRRMVLAERSNFLEAQGWVWAAHAMSPDSTPELAGLSGPWAKLDTGMRDRSGSSGQGQLRVALAPSLTAGVARGENVYQFRLSRL
jgi:tetratricopeptide (TPR) repeat protein